MEDHVFDDWVESWSVSLCLSATLLECPCSCFCVHLLDAELCFIGCFKSPSMIWIVLIPGWLVPGWPQSRRPQSHRLKPSFTPVLKTSQMWNSEGALIFDREAEGQENQSLGAGAAEHQGCCSCPGRGGKPSSGWWLIADLGWQR